MTVASLTKTIVVKNSLREMLRGMAVNTKIPGEFELCERFGVSRSTIRDAIGLLTSEGLLEKRHGVGTFSCEPAIRNKTVLAVIPSTTYLSPALSPFWFNIQFMLEGFSTRAAQEGVSTSITYLHPDQQPVEVGVSTLLRFKTDAYIFPDLGGNGPLIRHLVEHGCTCIIREPVCSNLTHSVYALLRDGVRNAVSHLIRSGRRRIAIFGSNPGDHYTHERFLGYSQALEEAGLSVDSRYVRSCDGFSRDAEQETRKMLSEGVRPDAIFGGTDLRCFGIIKALQDKGVKIPDDVAVVGVDNMPDDQQQEPTLSSVDFPLFQMGEVMFDIFSEVSAARNCGKFIHRSLECPLILRNSC